MREGRRPRSERDFGVITILSPAPRCGCALGGWSRDSGIASRAGDAVDLPPTRAGALEANGEMMTKSVFWLPNQPSTAPSHAHVAGAPRERAQVTVALAAQLRFCNARTSAVVVLGYSGGPAGDLHPTSSSCLTHKHVDFDPILPFPAPLGGNSRESPFMKRADLRIRSRDTTFHC